MPNAEFVTCICVHKAFTNIETDGLRFKPGQAPQKPDKNDDFKRRVKTEDMLLRDKSFIFGRGKKEPEGRKKEKQTEKRDKRIPLMMEREVGAPQISFPSFEGFCLVCLEMGMEPRKESQLLTLKRVLLVSALFSFLNPTINFLS